MKPRVRICRLDILPPDVPPWFECEGDGISQVGMTPRSAFEKWKAAVWESWTPVQRAFDQFCTAIKEGREDDAERLWERCK